MSRRTPDPTSAKSAVEAKRNALDNAILEHLRSAVAAALDTPEIQKTWALQGAEVPAVPASNVEAYVEGEIQRWSAANRKANIRLD